MWLYIAMALGGVGAGLGCWAAHMRMRKRTYLTPLPRYGVGVACGLLPWGAAAVSAITQAHNILEAVLVLIIGIGYVFLCAGFATWLAYENDRPRATEADAERLVSYIEGEHDGEAGGNPR